MNQDFQAPYPQNHLQGMLLVRPLQARLERDTELIGSMDCYCQVIIGQSKQNTHVHNRSGKNPQWHSQLQFKLQEEQFARIAVWDKEAVKSDDLVGEAEIDLVNVIFSAANQETGMIQQNIELFFNNKRAGVLQVEFQILVDGPAKGQKPEKRRGMVVFRPTHAKLIRDTETFSQMDPFVVINLGKTQKKTKTHNGGGKVPKWNDIIELRRNDEYFVEIKVLEEDVMSNDLVGEGQLSLQNLFSQGQVKESVEVYYDGQISGTVFFELEWLPDTESREGTIIAFPHSATLNRDTEVVGKMDPYCLIKIGQQQEKTQVHQKAGKNPRWADELQFYRTDEFEAIIEVYDEDTMSDDLVGSAHIALQDIFRQGQKKKEITIFFKEKEVGSVNIHWEWHPNSEVRPGIITARPLFADLNRNTDAIGNMDPYVELTIGQASQKTQPHLKGGKKPQWQDELVFRRQIEHFAYVTIWDKDTLSDDMVGEGKLALYDIFKKGRKRQQVVIFYKNKQIGILTIELLWKPDEELREGHIFARPIEATLDRDTDIIGKMDCYTVIKIGNNQHKSDISKNTGKFPKWYNEPLQFPRKQEYQALVQVWDQDLTYNDLVGEANFSLFEIFQKRRHQTWTNLYYKKDQLAGRILIEWEWRPKPSKQDAGAEARVRFINLQEGQKMFNSNLNQYLVALHNFDKLTVDDHLYDMFEQIVGQDFEEVQNTVVDLEKCSSTLHCEGYAELCNFFKTQVQGVQPNRENVLKVLKKFKKFIQLSQILKHEIDNLTQIPCCHKSIEILHEYIEMYERSPDLFQINPLVEIKNQIELERQQGNFARKEVRNLQDQEHQKYSNSQNALKDKNVINQSRMILKDSFGKETRDDENYYFSNQNSRLKLQSSPPKAKQDFVYPKEVGSAASVQELYAPQSFKSQDWLHAAVVNENYSKKAEEDKVNMYSQYKGDTPNMENFDTFNGRETETNQKQQFWKSQQGYFNDPQNLPYEYQSIEQRKKYSKFPQNQQQQFQQQQSEYEIEDPSINETYRVSSYQQNQNNLQSMAPDQEDSGKKQQQFTKHYQSPQKSKSPQPNNNNIARSQRQSQESFFRQSQSKKFDSLPPNKKKQNFNQQGSQSVQVTPGQYELGGSRMRQSKNRIFEPMANSTYAPAPQPVGQSRAMQGAQFTQSRTQFFNPNLPQIQEANDEMLEVSKKNNASFAQQSQHQTQDQFYQSQNNINNNNNNNNFVQAQGSQSMFNKQGGIYSIQDQISNSRVSQNLKQSQQVQRGGRVKKDRGLFQSLFW